MGKQETMVREVVHDETSLLKLPFYAFSRELAGSTHPEEVLAALRVLLTQLSMTTARVFLIPASPQGPPSTAEAPVETAQGKRWLLPIQGTDFALVFELQADGRAQETFKAIYPFVALAQAALHRLLTQDVWWPRLLSAVERIGALLEEQEIFEVLTETAIEFLDVSHAYVFRYLQEKEALRLEASSQVEPMPSMIEPLQVIPSNLMPGHYEVLESGQAATFVRGGKPDLSDWEWGVLFPPQVHQVLVIPFWLSTRDLGLLSLAVLPSASGVRVSMNFLRALLHHTALAVERARLFAEVAEARKEAELVLSKTLAGILLVDNDLKVQRANGAAAAVWEKSSAALVGLHVQELFGPEIVTSGSPLSRAKREGKAQGPSEWIIPAEEAHSRYLMLAVTPLVHEEARARVPGGSKEIYGYLLSFLDITHRKQLEFLREQLLANVTHELRTPIAVIRGYAELLKSQLPDDAPALWADSLKTIETRADDLLEMVEMHLDLAQLEAEAVLPHQERVSLSLVLQTALVKLRRKYGALPAPDVYIAPEVEAVWIDAHLFEQMVVHLLGNAIKFTPENGRVWFRAWEDAGDLHIEVGDTGTGISGKDLQHVFERFYRGDNAGYGIPGSGLGLTLVQRVVEVYRGTIDVSSEVGKGTVFHLILPGIVSVSSDDRR